MRRNQFLWSSTAATSTVATVAHIGSGTVKNSKKTIEIATLRARRGGVDNDRYPNPATYW